MNPFRLNGPALISFSGGRSSAFMLRCVLDAHGGALPDDMHVVFANTGEEHEGTLRFVRECGERWGVAIRWVEFIPEVPRWREVTYDTASRKGEPFDALVRWKQYLPNHFQKLCTEWLKVRPMAAFMASLGFTPCEPETKTTPYVPGDFDQVIGIRADEQSRVAKSAGRADIRMPLAASGYRLDHVLAFWAVQPFDLEIPLGQGNCRLCFEKGWKQLQNVIATSPDEAGAERWIARENLIGARFHRTAPTYGQLRQRARTMPVLPGVDLEDGGGSLPCACHD